MGQTPGLKNSLQITPDTKGHNPGLKIPFKSYLTLYYNGTIPR
jgi:hypothetical protein